METKLSDYVMTGFTSRIKAVKDDSERFSSWKAFICERNH